ncbi:hypothetical protein D3C75_1227950 [compost metagenome]
MAGDKYRSSEQPDVLEQKLARRNRDGWKAEAGFNHAGGRDHEAQGCEEQSGRQRTADQ